MPRQRTMTQQSTPTQQGVALDLHATSNASTHRAGNSRTITADGDRGGSLRRGAAAASAAAELLFAVSVVLAIGALTGDNGRRARSTRHVARAGPARRFERRDARASRTAATRRARTVAILAVLLAMVTRVASAEPTLAPIPMPTVAPTPPMGSLKAALESNYGDCYDATGSSCSCYYFYLENGGYTGTIPAELSACNSISDL